MKPTAAVHRLKRKVRVLTAQKRRLVYELRAAQTIHAKSPLPAIASPTIQVAS